MGDKKTLIIIALAAFVAFFAYSYYSAKKDVTALETQVSQLQSQIDSLKTRHDDLMSDKRISRISQRKIDKELNKESSSDKVLFSKCSITSKVIGRNPVEINILPEIEYTEEGFVTIKVTVDGSGAVIAASIDSGNSTIKNRKIRQACRDAAQKATFSTGPGEKAKGSITYTFSD